MFTNISQRFSLCGGFLPRRGCLLRTVYLEINGFLCSVCNHCACCLLGKINSPFFLHQNVSQNVSEWPHLESAWGRPTNHSPSLPEVSQTLSRVRNGSLKQQDLKKGCILSSSGGLRGKSYLVTQQTR